MSSNLCVFACMHGEWAQICFVLHVRSGFSASGLIKVTQFFEEFLKTEVILLKKLYFYLLLEARQIFRKAIIPFCLLFVGWGFFSWWFFFFFGCSGLISAIVSFKIIVLGAIWVLVE